MHGCENPYGMGKMVVHMVGKHLGWYPAPSYLTMSYGVLLGGGSGDFSDFSTNLGGFANCVFGAREMMFF